MSLCTCKCRCLRRPEKHIRFPGPKIIGSCGMPEVVLGTELGSSKGAVYTLKSWATLQYFNFNFIMTMIIRPKVLTIISVYILSIHVSKVLSRSKYSWASFHWLWKCDLQPQILLLGYYLHCPLGNTNCLLPCSPISKFHVSYCPCHRCCFYCGTWTSVCTSCTSLHSLLCIIAFICSFLSTSVSYRWWVSLLCSFQMGSSELNRRTLSCK